MFIDERPQLHLYGVVRHICHDNIAIFYQVKNLHRYQVFCEAISMVVSAFGPKPFFMHAPFCFHSFACELQMAN